ncbi:MAG: tetratricopeptide repeat protein [Candidatus Lokiarchaeota archaeon]|nr:tetratricopeptide repeat protein [Candidatus Harpocratesius repetitus]
MPKNIFSFLMKMIRIGSKEISSELESQLRNIEKLIQQEKIDDAKVNLKIIEENYHKEFKNPIVDIQIKLLNARIYEQIGNYSEALVIVENQLKNEKISNSSFLHVQALILKATILNKLRKNTQGLNIIENAETILDSIKDNEQTSIAQLKGKIANLKGDFLLKQGELEKARKCFLKSLKISEEFKDYPLVSLNLNNIGVTWGYSGELDKALDYYKKNVELCIEKGLESKISSSFNNIGECYRTKGDLTLALEYYQKSFYLTQKYEDKIGMAVTLHNIALIHQAKGQYDDAEKFFFDSLVLGEEIDFYPLIAETIFNLIKLYLEAGKKSDEEIQKYLLKLKKLDQKKKNKIINQQYRLSEAFILKKSERLINKAKAQEILQQITEEEIVEHELTVCAMLNLCELLILELKSTGKEEILKEIKKIIGKLYNIAKSQNSYVLLGEIYLLEAKISLLELNHKKARDLLNQAQNLAEERGLNLLNIKVSQEYDSMLKFLKDLSNLMRGEISFKDRINFSQIDQLLSFVIQKKELPKPNEETPVLLMLIDKGGLNIYSKSFVNQNDPSNEQLISGFITAINSFMKEVFKIQGSIERIRHQEYTIIIHQLKQFLICYVFRGESYFAVKKINTFVDALKQDEKLMNYLENDFQMTSQLINAKEFDSMVDSIFIK